MAMRSTLLIALLLVLAGCGETTAPVPPMGFTSVAAGSQHSCGLTEDGVVYCWGRGFNGELGIGRLGPGVFAPARTATAVRFDAITAGYYHTCGLAMEGGAYCWGWNNWGQVGSGDTETVLVPEPVPVAGGHVFTDLVAGWYHTCGITDSGAVLCWGLNGDGQLGDGSTGNRSAPTAIAAPDTTAGAGAGPFQALGAGGFHTCAADTDGRAHCWGRNIEGQLGTGDTEPSSVPVEVTGSGQFHTLDAGRAHTCGVTPGSAIYCWGSNSHGELGVGSLGERGLPGSTTPARVARNQAFVDVSAGYEHTCARDEPGVGYCWGAGLYGQLGLGTTEVKVSPRAISNPRFRDIVASHGTHTCGVTPARHLYCWGSGEAGQLGNPTTTATALPLRVVNPETP